MKIAEKLLLVAILLAVIFLVGCKSDEHIPDTITLNSGVSYSISVSAAGGNYKFGFSTTNRWTCSTSDSWIKITSGQEGTAGSFELNITIDSNITHNSREGFVYIKCGSAVCKLSIHQFESGAIILSQKKYELQGNDTTITIEFKSNIEFEINIPPDVDWIKETTTKSLKLHSKEFSILSNILDDTRQTEIIVKGKTQNIADTIVVIQYGQIIFKERMALISIFNKLGGANWSNKENWCTDKPVGNWEGITTDNDGRVTTIDLQPNLLIGEFPVELCSFQELVELRIGGSGTMTGKIPSEIGQLKKIEGLYLAGNRLSGRIPAEIGDLKKLRSLNLSYNMLEESIPDEMVNLSELSYVNLNNNNITGGIPSGIFNLPKLEDFLAENNSLSENLPKTIGNASSLRYLSLANNELTGSIPVEFVKIVGNIDWKSTYNNTGLKNNKLSGYIPEELYGDTSWDICWRKIIPQKSGFGFIINGVPIPSSKISFKDVNGTIRNLGDIYKNNKYTVLLQWNNENVLMYRLAKALDKYMSQGLAVVMFDSSPGYNSYDKDSLMKIIKKTGASNSINFLYSDHSSYNPGDLEEEVANFIKIGDCKTVQAEVVNQKGEIIFSYMEMFGDDPRFNKNTQTELISFLENIFGEIPNPFYESSDFSQDGKVIQLQQATVGRGIDLVIMGDGFTDKYMAHDGEYESKMKDAYEMFFSIEPVKSFRDRFNVYMVKAVSKNELFLDGASTALNAKFGERTYVTGNPNLAWSYAEKVTRNGNPIDPGAALIVAVINSEARAGTALLIPGLFGSIAYCPYCNNDIKQFTYILVHEAVGHGFGKLADEYWYPGSYWPIPDWKIQELNSFYNEYGWYSNIDFTNDPLKIRWSDFLTNENYKSTVGIFEGGHLDYTAGVYRSSENSVMHGYSSEFNAPSRLAIYKAIMERSGEEYSFEKFLQYDKINRVPTRAVYAIPKDFVPLAPPVIVRDK